MIKAIILFFLIFFGCGVVLGAEIDFAGGCKEFTLNDKCITGITICANPPTPSIESINEFYSPHCNFSIVGGVLVSNERISPAQVEICSNPSLAPGNYTITIATPKNQNHETNHTVQGVKSAAEHFPLMHASMFNAYIVVIVLLGVIGSLVVLLRKALYRFEIGFYVVVKWNKEE